MVENAVAAMFPDSPKKEGDLSEKLPRAFDGAKLREPDIKGCNLMRRNLVA
jgi:hypothetical protein